MPRERRPSTPLDAAALERLALRYVERFATSRGRLRTYLDRKVREHGGSGEISTQAIADRMADLGYVDDHIYAEARASAMTRSGYGAHRVTMALRQAAIEEEEIAVATGNLPAVEAAIAFARRRRIGPFAAVAAEPAQRERQIAAMVRAGHNYALARRIAGTSPGVEASEYDFER